MGAAISFTSELPVGVRDAVEQRLDDQELELPVLPRVASEVMRLCNSDDADAKAVSDVLHSDPAIAGNVLRIANSPMFGGNQQISSLQQAVGRIGLARLTEVVMTVTTCSKLLVVSEHLQPIVGDLRLHSLLSGLFARETARTSRLNVETAFLQGLLHTMGKPVLLMMLDELELEFGVLKPEAIAATLDRYHARAGALLCRKWELSSAIGDAVAHQNDWTEMEDPPGGAPLIQLASLLARATTPEVVPDASELQSDAAVAALNLYPDELQALCDAGPRLVETAQQML